MIPRFPFLGQLTYDQHLLANKVITATQGMSSGPAQDIVRATLYGNLVGAQATIRSGQETVSAIYQGTQEAVSVIHQGAQETVAAISDSSNMLGSKIDHAMLANLFGNLAVAGTIAISTGLVLRRMDRLTVGVERLGAQFSEGMSLLASKLDAQADSLHDIKDQLAKIHETLKSPTITRATEHRNLGLQRLGQGLWQEAATSFTDAISLDQTDPISHLMLAKLFLDAVDEEANLHEPHCAFEHAQKARKYAAAGTPEAPLLQHTEEEALYVGAVAQMAIASQDRAKKSEVEVKDSLLRALATIEVLLKMNPRHLQGMYLRAKLLILLDRTEDAKLQFAELVKEDVQFLSSAATDGDFGQLSASGRSVLLAVEDWYRSELRASMVEFIHYLKAVEAWRIEIPIELQKWVLTRNLNDLALSQSRFDARPFLELIDADQEIVGPLRVATQLMEARYTSRLNSLTEELLDLQKKLSKEIKDIEWEYFAGDDVLAMRDSQYVRLKFSAATLLLNDPVELRHNYERYRATINELVRRASRAKEGTPDLIRRHRIGVMLRATARSLGITTAIPFVPSDEDIRSLEATIAKRKVRRKRRLITLFAAACLIVVAVGGVIIHTVDIRNKRENIECRLFMLEEDEKLQPIALELSAVSNALFVNGTGSNEVARAFDKVRPRAEALVSQLGARVEAREIWMATHRLPRRWIRINDYNVRLRMKMLSVSRLCTQAPTVDEVQSVVNKITAAWEEINLILDSIIVEAKAINKEEMER